MAFPQKNIERKIVIEEGKFYFVSYHEEEFKYILHVGSVLQSVSQAIQIELPWGSSYDFPLNQFMWDVYKDTFYCVNRTPHSLNDQTQNIKKVAIEELIDFANNKTTRDEYIFIGIDAYAYVDNRGHKDILGKHIYQDTYFSDMCVDENGKIVYFTTVDSMRRWYKNDFVEYAFTHSNDSILLQPLLVENGNALLFLNMKIELHSKDGLLQMHSKGINCNQTLSTLVVINKDQKGHSTSYFFLLREHLELPVLFSELIENYAICTNLN